MKTQDLLTIEVRTEQDIVLARQRALQIAELLGFDLQAQTKLGTAVSELARNAFTYARGGRVRFQYSDDRHRRLILAITDAGPGIANLQDILDGRYTSRTGMGLGLIGTRRIMDQFDVVSAPGKGTSVTVAKFLPPRAAAVTAETLAGIAQALAVGLPDNPLGEIQQQNQELLRVLDELQSRQAELDRLNAELEDTNRGVVALYAELDARADFLRRNSKANSRFLSNMTHEFRTPLNSVLALTSMLASRADGELTVEQARQVGFIHDSAKALSDLVNELLDAAKADDGRIRVRPEDFEVAKLLGALKGMLRPMIPAMAKLNLIFDEPAAEIHLHTDEGKVSQVLRNLISNALKFTERGEVRVSVVQPTPDSIRFLVTDTGVGIKPEDISRIFEEFGQVDTGVVQRFQGSGLGLPLSKHLAELLGGRVTVDSRPGIGSTFALEIPMRYHGAAQVGAVEPQLARVPYKRQALIIDDDDVSRYLLRSLLPTSFEVMEAVSGADGIEAAQRLHPDVVFLDLQMPGQSGFEVLDVLKQHGDTADIPVVVYSAQAMDPATRLRLIRADAVMSAKNSEVQPARAALHAVLEHIGLLAAPKMTP